MNYWYKWTHIERLNLLFFHLIYFFLIGRMFSQTYKDHSLHDINFRLKYLELNVSLKIIFMATLFLEFTWLFFMSFKKCMYLFKELKTFNDIFSTFLNNILAFFRKLYLFIFYLLMYQALNWARRWFTVSYELNIIQLKCWRSCEFTMLTLFCCDSLLVMFLGDRFNEIVQLPSV